jgi:hypothetical protein
VLGFVPTSLASHRKTKLRDATNANRDHHNCPAEGRDEERDGDGDSTARGEELDAYVTGVLRNEVDERDAKDDGHDDADPRGRDSRVAKVFTRVRGSPTVIGPGLVGGRGWRPLCIAAGLQVFALAHAYLGCSQRVGRPEQVSLARQSEPNLLVERYRSRVLRASWRRHLLKMAVHHHVREVVAGRTIEDSSAGDELQRSIRAVGPVHQSIGKCSL